MSNSLHRLPTSGLCIFFEFFVNDNMAEWLRRQIRNLMGSARGGSNPSVVASVRFQRKLSYTNVVVASGPVNLLQCSNSLAIHYVNA